jgi:hypothetical protein
MKWSAYSKYRKEKIVEVKEKGGEKCICVWVKISVPDSGAAAPLGRAQM